jgi:hypothetical protein
MQLRLLFAVTALGVSRRPVRRTSPSPSRTGADTAAGARIVAEINGRGQGSTLKADVSFNDRPPLKVKLRKAEPGAESFNNVPRYDLAAYELQKLFIDPAEYVVPPTSLRMIPLDDFRRYSPDVEPTFRGASEVLGCCRCGCRVDRRGRSGPALFSRRHCGATSAS